LPAPGFAPCCPRCASAASNRPLKACRDQSSEWRSLEWHVVDVADSVICVVVLLLYAVFLHAIFPRILGVHLAFCVYLGAA
jgi:hypothetical protein